MSADKVTSEGAASAARFLGAHDRVLLSRVEDAGLNASAPPQQRWMDGWLVRTNPGKAQRARCINAVAPGRQPLADKLTACARLYRSLGLPMLVRITPFTAPPTLDADLAARGYGLHDETRVMVLPRLVPESLEAGPAPAGTALTELPAAPFAEAIGALRASPPEVRRAHAERLLASPVPYRGFVLSRGAEVLACGQFTLEGDLAGLYDIGTAEAYENQGIGRWLCTRLLALAAGDSRAAAAYLQVGADNEAARHIYSRLGFEDGYSYHYRLQPAAG